MFNQQINTAILVSALAAHMAATSLVTAEPDYWTYQAEENLRYVIRNMTHDFHAFGICGEQASMLAEQTADFGTIGIMTTIAAIGIGPLVVNIVATGDGAGPEAA